MSPMVLEGQRIVDNRYLVDDNSGEVTCSYFLSLAKGQAHIEARARRNINFGNIAVKINDIDVVDADDEASRHRAYRQIAAAL